MTTNNQPVCTTCGKPHPFPDGTVPKHPFNDGSLSFADTFGRKLPDGSRALPGTEEPPAQAVGNAWPFDPVLRQALIDKGVITPDDLINAEKQIKAVTNAVMGGQQ